MKSISNLTIIQTLSTDALPYFTHGLVICNTTLEYSVIMKLCDVCVGIIPAGRPLCSSIQAPVERGWMRKWLSDTEYHGHSAASYLRKNTQTKGENKTPHK